MAELLVLNRDATPEPRSYKRGDIVVVMPDGHAWGNAEGLPDFVQASLPGVSPELIAGALTLPHQIEAAELAPSALRAVPSLYRRYTRAQQPERITRRRYRVPASLLDAHTSGRITLNLAHLEDKSLAT